VEVPIIGFGTYPFCSKYKNRDDEAVQLLRHGFDLGITYFDTATSYGGGWAQSMVGRALKDRRKEAFIATKIYGRFTYDEIMRNFEGTLERLQTDYVDLLYVHNLQTVEEANKFGQKGGIVETYYKLREQKVARFIGVSGHSDPIPVTLFIERHDLDCVLIALNAAMQGVVYDNSISSFKNDPTSRHSFETIALPAALKKNMGILAMKTSAQGQLIGSAPKKADIHTLLRYTWSLPITSSMIGMTNIAEVEQNVAWASAFKPMPTNEMSKLSDRLSTANKATVDNYFANHSDTC
jgi:aryl-alcohol dehydrogenase-like predicted oxidoreductase